MTEVILIKNFGDVDVLEIEKTSLPSPKNNEVLVRQTAIGINYDDILMRQGVHKLPLPLVIGSDACGVVEEVGPEVKSFHPGDRVAYVTAPAGAYADSRIINADYLVNVPDYVDDDDVAACLKSGMTAHYLIKRTFFVRQNNTILVTDAHNGAAVILCEMAKREGAKVIAAVGDNHKIQALGSMKLDLLLNYNEENFSEKVMEYTKGEGVDVIYDFIGSRQMQVMHKLIGKFGLIVGAGFKTGFPGNVDFEFLYSKSAFVTCPNFLQYKEQKLELVLSASEIFAQIQKGYINTSNIKKYRLDQAKEAHRNLENNSQLGQSIFII